MKHQLFKIIIFLWNIWPFKKSLSKIVKYYPKLKAKLYRDLRYKGTMHVNFESGIFKLYNPGFTTIENEIFWKGIDNGWEKISMGIWGKLVINSNVILDIGANSGVYSFVAASLNPNAEIFAFEPVKRTSEIFKKNLVLNPDFKISLIEKAVSNNNGVATFYDLPTDSQYSASLNEEMLTEYPSRITYDVETVALDNLSVLKSKKIDLIKLDVEMHEPEAIEGMINILKENQPAMLIEILTEEIAEKIQSLFDNIKDFEYLFFNIDEQNKPIQIDSLKKSNHYNVLLLPKNKLAQVEHLVLLETSTDIQNISS